MWGKSVRKTIVGLYLIFLLFIFFAGCGFIGRHLVAYLIENDLVSKVSFAFCSVIIIC